jgi:hypothetical protein
MYDQTIDPRRRLTLRHHCFRSGLTLVPLAAALGFVLFTTLRCPLKDDIAWLLYVAREWLSGRQLYVDLIEINPPMIVWIPALPSTLSAALGVAAKFVAVPFFATCMLGTAGWCAKLLRGYGLLGTAPLPLFVAVGTVLLALPGQLISRATGGSNPAPPPTSLDCRGAYAKKAGAEPLAGTGEVCGWQTRDRETCQAGLRNETGERPAELACATTQYRTKGFEQWRKSAVSPLASRAGPHWQLLRYYFNERPR